MGNYIINFSYISDKINFNVGIINNQSSLVTSVE